MTIRPARAGDLSAVARLHASRIAEGFLSSLGERFLARLYRRALRSPRAFVVVADDDDGTVTGFAAGVERLGDFYREFLVRDGWYAGAVAAPRLVRTLPRVVETLRYPAAGGDELPAAEILAVAVAPDAAGRGLGRELVRAATSELADRGVTSAKVVTTTDNAAALTMYRAAGFVDAAPLEVHEGRSSEVLVWTA